MPTIDRGRSQPTLSALHAYDYLRTNAFHDIAITIHSRGLDRRLKVSEVASKASSEHQKKKTRLDPRALRTFCLVRHGATSLELLTTLILYMNEKEGFIVNLHEKMRGCRTIDQIV